MIFISHRTLDKRYALELKDLALGAGYSPEQLFLDSDHDSGIGVGDNWQEKLYSTLRKARAMIMVCSPNLLTSQWCFVELGYAKATAMSIFPVKVEACELGSTLGPIQAIDIPAEAGADRNAAFASLWKALEARHLGPEDIPPWPTDRCPFPGLPAFTEEFAPAYFGREPERDQLLRELDQMRKHGQPRMLMITGGSGSGKSSLLRAGVLPWLNHSREVQHWLSLPALRFNETSEQHTLLLRLVEELVARFPDTCRPNWTTLRKAFESASPQEAAKNFSDLVTSLNMACNYSDRTTVLILDQFEELLADTSRTSGEHFLQFLQALLSGADRRVLVIGTMRSDYLDAYKRHTCALEHEQILTYRLSPFPWERMAEVIVKPAALAGVTFTDELLERLKQDAPVSDPLPLLAFTLEKLFRECVVDKRIELTSYEKFGGMTGAIEQAVTKIMPPHLPAETENALRLSFVRHLVRDSAADGEVVACPARWSEIPPAAQPLLEEFVKKRLLHTTVEHGVKTVEVSHESLFRCWPKLEEWLKDSAEVRRWRHAVEHDCNSALRIGKRWRGLSPLQLEMSRDWPRTKRGELSREEIKWIESAIRKELLIRIAIAAVIVFLVGAWRFTVILKQDAEQSREKAIQHLQHACETVDVSLTGISELLRYSPMPHIREDMLGRAATDYDQFVRIASDNPKLEIEQGQTLLRLGNVHLEQGKAALAEDDFRRAASHFDRLWYRNKDIKHRIDWATAQKGLTHALADQSKMDEAGNEIDAAVRELEKVLEPGHDDTRNALGEALLEQSRLFLESRQAEEAKQRARRAISHFEAQSPQEHARLGEARMTLGEVFAEFGRYQESLQELQSAIAAIDQLVQLEPDQHHHIDARAAARISLAEIARKLGDYSLAEAVYRQSIRDFDAQALITVPRLVEWRAVARLDLGQLLHEEGRNPEAREILERARDEFQSLPNDYREQRRCREALASVHDALGETLDELGQHELAKAELDLSLKMFQSLNETPLDKYEERLSHAARHLGQVLGNLGEAELAVREFDVATKRLSNLVERHPDLPDIRHALAYTFAAAGDAYFEIERFAAAKEAFEAARNHWRQLLEKSPTPEIQNRFARFLICCPDKSFHDARNAVTLSELARRGSPAGPEFAGTYGAALVRAGEPQLGLCSLIGARELRGESTDLELFFIALAQLQLSSPKDAEKAFRDGVAWRDKHRPSKIELIRLQKEVSELLFLR